MASQLTINSQNSKECQFTVNNITNSKKGFKRTRKGYIKNKAVFNLLKTKGLVQEGRKYSVIRNLNDVDGLGNILGKLDRKDLQDILNSKNEEVLKEGTNGNELPVQVSEDGQHDDDDNKSAEEVLDL